MDQNGENSTIRLPVNLDPTAEEFRPRTQQQQQPQPITLIQPHIYYPYPSLPPPPPPLYPSPQLPMSYYDGSNSSSSVGGGGVCYHQPSSQSTTAYVSQNGVTPLSASPTRSLLLTTVPIEVTEESIKNELQIFGEIRAIQLERLRGEGLVIVHFYDLRHAETALMEIREQHMQQQNRLRQHYNMLLTMRPMMVPIPFPFPIPPSFNRGLISGKTIWAQFVFPVGVPVVDAHNQGTIVLFNLDSSVSASMLKEIFQTYGVVKEVRETPMKKHQRFVEYFDIRAADRAIKAMDGKEINGKKVLIEFSRPGGHRRFLHTPTPTNTISTARNNNNNSLHSSPFPPPTPSSSLLSASKSFSRSISDVSSNSSSQNKKTNSPNINRRTSMGQKGSTSLSVSNGSGSEKSFKSGSSSVVKNPKKNSNNNSKKGVSSTKEQQSSRNKSVKGRHRMFDSQFLIKEEVGSNCQRDTRTTVMIKNIPNKYSQKLLLNMLDNHCINCNAHITDNQPLSSYDFVYLPIDFNNKCNVGYGFVNMTSPEATLRLYKGFNKQHWEVFNSRKICEVSYARLQGLEALKDHFKNSKFACETDDYLPVLFSPPRDGKQLSEPMPVGGYTNDTINKNLQPLDDLLDNSNESKDEQEEWVHGDLDHGGDDEDGHSDEAIFTCESSSSSKSTITSVEATSPQNVCLLSSELKNVLSSLSCSEVSLADY
ncbi:hypothetical protein AQUCO_05600049v1 [Aquilegia coerulea]|uniref:RRM domain-containing protein n=1 Tax=Aquilegia coerulea TaxID=218851 RepID=A0A2G5CGC8_AQUCA|nr:hypothetical protein AQUCO_05600049v1 [Aquilegia coerulea]